VFPIGRLFAAYMSPNVEVVLQNFVKVWEPYKKSGPGSVFSFSFHTESDVCCMRVDITSAKP